MNARIVLLSLLALSLSACQSLDRAALEPAIGSRPGAKLEFDQKTLAKILPAYTVLVGPTLDCRDDDEPCDFDVTVTWVDGKYCLATAPHIRVVGVGQGRPMKTIRWNLVTTGFDPTKYELAFDRSHGMLVLFDDTHKQLPVGQRGRANAAGTKYFMRTVRSVPKAEAVYLPVVVMIDKTGTEPYPSLCAATDPKIVNAEN